MPMFQMRKLSIFLHFNIEKMGNWNNRKVGILLYVCQMDIYNF